MNRSILVAAVVFLSFLVAAPPGHAAWTWPVRGEVITPYLNGDDPYAGGQHRGIDVAADVGAPVVAATPGEVRFAGVAGASGLTVSLRTADGTYDTSYLHLSTVSVHKGDAVAAGDRLGAVGTTGTRSAVAPHLHFGVRDAGTSAGYHDPLGFLPPLATTGQPQPASPTPSPEAVPSTPSPQPAPRPAPTAHRAPSGEHVQRPAPNRSPRVAPNHRPHAAPNHSPHAAPNRRPHGSPHHTPRGAPNHSPHERPRVALRSAPSHQPHAAHHLMSRPARGGPAHPASASVHHRQRAASSEPITLPDNRSPGSQIANARARDGNPADGHAAHANSGDPGAVKTPPSAGASGPDAAWALACLGLLVAAALVGTSGGGRDFVRRRGAAVGRAVRPLLGRG